MTHRILHITPDFNYTCGRSKLVHLYLKYFSNCPNYETHFITNGGDALDKLRELPNLKFKMLRFSSGYKNLFYYRYFYNELYDYIKKNKIEIVHTHHRFPELIAVKIARAIGLKTIFSTHGFVKGFQKMSFKSDVIISVSNSSTQFLIDYFNIEKEKIVTLYNPVKPSVKIDQNIVEQFKKDHALQRNDRIILFVGRFIKDKGFDTLLKTFEILTSEINNIVFIAIGNSDSQSVFLNKKPESRKFIFLDSTGDINYLYAMADIIVLPSRSDTFPYVMVEAGIFKKAFIGGNTGGIAEFIEEGNNGLLVNPENPNELASKILFLLKNSLKANELGEKLFEKVNQLCNYNNYFSKLEKIYHKLLSSK